MVPKMKIRLRGGNLDKRFAVKNISKNQVKSKFKEIN